MIPGLRVGHVTDATALTGCTVILSDAPAVGGVEIRGWAAGVHGLEFLDPRHLVPTLDERGDQVAWIEELEAVHARGPAADLAAAHRGRVAQDRGAAGEAEVSVAWPTRSPGIIRERAAPARA